MVGLAQRALRLRWLALLALAAFYVASGAHAQPATVVGSCGSTNFPAGSLNNTTVDVNGQSCSGAMGPARVVTACGAVAPFGATPAGSMAYPTTDIHGNGCLLGGSSGATSVWSASDAAANGFILSNGGLTVTQPNANSWQVIRGTIGKSSGKLYVEFKTSVPVSTYIMVGMADAAFVITGGFEYFGQPYSGGLQTSNNGFQGSTGFSPLNVGNINTIAANDIIGMAVDFGAQQFWIAQNNTWVVGDPSTGASPLGGFVLATVGALFPALALYGTGTGVWTLQPTAASEKYAPPAGFSPWN